MNRILSYVRLEIGRELGRSGVRRPGSKQHMDGVGAVGGSPGVACLSCSCQPGHTDTQGDGPREQAQYDHYRICPSVDKLI